MLISRKAFVELQREAARAALLEVKLLSAEGEIRRLTDVLIEMKKGGFEAGPVVRDEPWDPYSTLEQEKPLREPGTEPFFHPEDGATTEDPELEELARSEIARVFSGTPGV